MSVEVMVAVHRLAELLNVSHRPLTAVEVLDLAIETLEEADAKGVFDAGEAVVPSPPPVFIVGQHTAAVLMVAADEHGVVRRFQADPGIWRRVDTVYRWVHVADDPIAITRALDTAEGTNAPAGCGWYHVATLGDDKPDLDVLLDATVGQHHISELRASVEAALTAWQQSS